MKNIYYLCSVQTFERYIDIVKKLTIFAPTYANTLYKCSVAVMPERFSFVCLSNACRV